MDIQSRKLKFIQEFLKLQNEDLLLRLENLLKSSKNIDKSKPLSIAELNKRINQSMEDSKNDRLIDSDGLMQEIEKWR